MKPDTVVITPAQQAVVGTRNAVEAAIGASKADKSTTWEQMPPTARITPWGWVEKDAPCVSDASEFKE